MINLTRCKLIAHSFSTFVTYYGDTKQGCLEKLTGVFMRNIRLSESQEYKLNQASSGLSNFFCLVFAALIIIWLCNDISAGLTASLHHESIPTTSLTILGWRIL